MNLTNILTSGYTFKREESELKLQFILFNSLLIFNMTFIGLASIARFISAQYTQSAFDFVYVLLGFISFYLSRQSKTYFKRLVYFILLYSFPIVTLTFYANLNPIAGMSWYFVLLLTSFFLAGKRIGTLVFFVSLSLIALISLEKHHFSLVELVIGVIPFIIALISMYFFEKRNFEFKQQIEHELFKLHEVLDKSPVSIVITDSDGNIEYSNPYFSQLTGYSTQELLGKNPRILKSDFHPESYYKLLWNEITHNTIWNGIFKNISKSGTEYWEKAIIAPVKNEKGELSNFISIKQEITQEIYLKEELIQKEQEESENFEKTLESFVKMVEQRDTYTAGHSQRVADYALRIAKEMNCSEEECELVYRASILHDIGKIATPDNVLLKPGKLTKLEYKLIQEHVQASYDILISIPMYKPLAEIIIYHHERYDGKGYPSGYKEDEIPLLSHIMMLSDAFDAMTTNRIYKGRKNVAEALEELQEFSGKQFHPTVVIHAIKALETVFLQEQVNQLPQTDLEKERFSYFYRDRVTNLYNIAYLKHVLNQHSFNDKKCFTQVLYMHNFSRYNKKYGWNKGDELLESFGQFLSPMFKEAQIFRIHGNTFVIISEKEISLSLSIFKTLEILSEHNITISGYKTDKNIDNVSDLEEYKSAEKYR